MAIPTWFWFDRGSWHSVRASATLGGVTATVTATPVAATWDPGDGSAPVTCRGPGQPYAPDTRPTCTHTYDVAGRYNVRVTVTWHATWTSSTGATGRQADVRLAGSRPITVRSAQAVTD